MADVESGVDFKILHMQDDARADEFRAENCDWRREQRGFDAEHDVGPRAKDAP